MSAAGPRPVEHDSRGILGPLLLQRRVELSRYPVGADLDGIIDRFWAVEWELPDGQLHRQQVVTHPCANISVVGAPRGGAAAGLEACVSGVARDVSTRVLAGSGWAVAAMTTPGGLGALTVGPAAAFTDRVVPIDAAVAAVGDAEVGALLATLMSASDQEARVGLLAAAVSSWLAGADPDRVRAAREVAAVARLAETDRSVRRVGELASAVGIGARTVQRLFAEYAGVSPAWVLRRYRLLDAAELVRGGEAVAWAEVAQRLGYADQSHLIRDFRAVVGQTPSAYAAEQVRLRSADPDFRGA